MNMQELWVYKKSDGFNTGNWVRREAEKLSSSQVCTGVNSNKGVNLDFSALASRVSKL